MRREAEGVNRILPHASRLSLLASPKEEVWILSYRKN
jgi:hypothetical protein